jgi:hypothetical protein
MSRHFDRYPRLPQSGHLRELQAGTKVSTGSSSAGFRGGYRFSVRDSLLLRLGGPPDKVWGHDYYRELSCYYLSLATILLQ